MYHQIVSVHNHHLYIIKAVCGHYIDMDISAQFSIDYSHRVSPLDICGRDVA